MDAKLLADGGCLPGLADATLLPPFFEIDSYQFWDVDLATEVAVAFGTREPASELDNRHVDGLRAAASGSPDERHVVASRSDNVVVYGVVLRQDGAVDFVGLCVGWWEQLLNAYAEEARQRPADVLAAAFSDPSGSAAESLRAGVERQWLGEESDVQWESTPVDERVYRLGTTPTAVLDSLVEVRVAVRFPSEWRREQVIICPRAASAWNVCVSSQAAADGHTIVWSVYVEPGHGLDWYSLGREPSFEDAALIGRTSFEVVEEAQRTSGGVLLELPLSAEGAASNSASLVELTTSRALTDEDIEAIEADEARVGDVAVTESEG